MDHPKRIEELKAAIKRLTGDQEVLLDIERLPPAAAVAFLEQVIRVEKAVRDGCGEPKGPTQH